MPLSRRALSSFGFSSARPCLSVFLTGFSNFGPHFWPHMIWWGSCLNLCQSLPGPHISLWRLLFVVNFVNPVHEIWQTPALTDVPIIVNASLLHHIQICVSRPHHIDALQWNGECFFFRHVKLNSRFNVITIDEVTLYRPKVSVCSDVIFWFCRLKLLPLAPPEPSLPSLALPEPLLLSLALPEPSFLLVPPALSPPPLAPPALSSLLLALSASWISALSSSLSTVCSPALEWVLWIRSLLLTISLYHLLLRTWILLPCVCSIPLLRWFFVDRSRFPVFFPVASSWSSSTIDKTPSRNSRTIVTLFPCLFVKASTTIRSCGTNLHLTLNVCMHLLITHSSCAVRLQWPPVDSRTRWSNVLFASVTHRGRIDLYMAVRFHDADCGFCRQWYRFPSM